MTFDLPAAIRRQLARADDSPALAHAGIWRSQAWVAQAAGALNAMIGEAASAGLVARNRPHHVAAFAANIAARQDWTDDALAAARMAGSMAVSADDG